MTPARKWSGSILTTPEPAQGSQPSPQLIYPLILNTFLTIIIISKD